MSCEFDDLDPDVCRARAFGHHCAHDDGHDGLHNCSCGVRWREPS